MTFNHLCNQRALLASALLVTGIAQAQTPTQLKESPLLTARVTAKEIPSVAERVGAEPAVIKPNDRVGKYGGIMRTALRGGGDHNAILRVVGNQGLVRWNLRMTAVEPGVAKSWTTSNGGAVYTFSLRKGMKWSDGKPFTADDVVFSMNDLVLNKEFYPSVPGRYAVKDVPVKVEKVDELSVRFTFAAPYPLFLQSLAAPLGQHPTLFQRAHCSQFHPKYGVADAIASQIKAGNHKDWAALMRQRCGDIEVPARWAALDRPTLDPWVITEPYRGGATRVAMKRNPYFWQVDTAGNQLPYVDEVQFAVISDVETIMLKTIGGEFDLMLRHITNVNNKPVLAENKSKARIELVELEGTNATDVALYFNLTNKNPQLRELFRNKDFRIAVSHAIDRKEIAESAYLGAGEAYQVGPHPSHPLHNKQLSYQYLTHNPKLANDLMDKIGLRAKDAQGNRQFSDGKKVFFTVDFPVNNPHIGDILNLVKRDLKVVGIDMSINAVERSLFYDRAAKNDHDVGATIAPGGLDPTEETRAIVADHPIDSRQSLEWQKWFESNGKLGQEPTPSMKKRFEWLEQWRGAASPAIGETLFKQILQEAANEFEIVGIVRTFGSPGIRRNNLRNVPPTMVNAWTSATPAQTLPQQYFFD
jgi:peptide/nickel transport system substrate-binding protein